MLDKQLWIAVILGAMLLIALLGIGIVLFYWFVLNKQPASLVKLLWPFLLYGIYPFVSDKLLNVKNPQTFLPYINPQIQIYIHLFIFFAGLAAMIIYYKNLVGG